MAVLEAVCRRADAAGGERLCAYVCVVHMLFHIDTHTHTRWRRRCRTVILMGAECYFILPLVTAVSRERERPESLCREPRSPSGSHCRPDESLDQIQSYCFHRIFIYRFHTPIR